MPVDSNGPGALAGLRVLDLSRFIAGPLACQILGDMGADVIKVERPSGEDARQFEPSVDGESLYAMNFNRNKRGITLNTRNPLAIEVLEALIRRSDVVVENYRPGTLEAMGLGYAHMAQLNPKVILTSISGFGQTGPNADRVLFDAIAQAASGLMSLTGEPDGPPVLAGTFVADYVAAFHGVMGTLLALQARHRTGVGQHVDVACFDAVFAMLGSYASTCAMLGIETTRNGSRDRITVPANVYPSADGFVYIHAGPNSLFPRFCQAMGRPELAQEPKFADHVARLANVDELDKLVSAWTAPHTSDELGSILAAVGIPFARVATLAEAVSSPQVPAREMMITMEHPKAGPVQVPGIPIKLSKTPGTIRKPPPVVGADTVEVLTSELGLDANAIERLYREGAL